MNKISAHERVEESKLHAQQDAKEISFPSADQVKAKWKQQVGNAKIIWGKLTEDELLKIEGHAERLTGLIQERYVISRDEAEKQVKDFWDKKYS